jgi:hypothetical protein
MSIEARKQAYNILHRFLIDWNPRRAEKEPMFFRRFIGSLCMYIKAVADDNIDKAGADGRIETVGAPQKTETVDFYKLAYNSQLILNETLRLEIGELYAALKVASKKLTAAQKLSDEMSREINQMALERNAHTAAVRQLREVLDGSGLK